MISRGMLKGLFDKSIPGRVVRDNIVVIDSALPSKNPIGPRNSDLLEFSKKIPNFKYYTMYPMKPGPNAWFTHGYGMTKSVFRQNLKVYETIHPEVRSRIKLLSEKKRYKINLAYTYFLAETYTLLPFLEKNKIPFIFLLNPGGAFGINNSGSDNMLKEIFASKYFKKVIVNQSLFQTYLLDKKLCKASDIVYDFSGSVQFNPSDVETKKYYKKDKSTFDVCFVAAKYTEKGVDKGYDIFISAAKNLVENNPDIQFHVVGGFDENEIDVTALKDKITFYGYLPAASLPKFYSGMDIFVSPNRPFMLYEGNSDGFPLAAGAMYCGVCGLNSDDLNMNTEFSDDEIVIIKTDYNDVVRKIKHLQANLDELYMISRNGKKKAQHIYDIEAHITKRVELFEKETKGAI